MIFVLDIGTIPKSVILIAFHFIIIGNKLSTDI